MEFVVSNIGAVPVELKDAFVAVQNIDLAFGTACRVLSATAGDIEGCVGTDWLVVDVADGDLLVLVWGFVEFAPLEIGACGFQSFTGFVLQDDLDPLRVAHGCGEGRRGRM